ncbi:hypothetical protein IWX64_000447 [Arthrobacter sp. CAN_A212]|uniref:hypothetical protein n=1 Tax=Arthrobacter sp. CAN_A212 TaxID=2787719 RepID=UPI001A2EB6E5
MSVQTSSVTKVLAAWLLGLLVVIAGAITAVVVANSFIFSPEEQVHDYLEALSDGDGERALGLLNASVPAANAAMLDGAGLQQSAAAVEDVVVGDAVPVGDNRADVTVTYTVRGTEHATTFPLERTGAEWLFFDTWEFVPTMLPTVDLTVINQGEATLNDTRVAMPEGRNQFAVFYPGSFEAHYTSDYFAAPAQTVAVTERSEGHQMALPTAATAVLVEEVTAQVRRFLDECAAQTVFQPANCPFNFQTESRVAGDIRWAITEYPTVAIEPFDGSWEIEPLSGTAELTTSLQDLFTGTIEAVTVPREFGFTARLSVDGDDVTVTPVVQY